MESSKLINLRQTSMTDLNDRPQSGLKIDCANFMMLPRNTGLSEDPTICDRIGRSHMG